MHELVAQLMKIVDALVPLLEEGTGQAVKESARLIHRLVST